MWIVYVTDNSKEVPGLILSEENVIYYNFAKHFKDQVLKISKLIYSCP